MTIRKTGAAASSRGNKGTHEGKKRRYRGLPPKESQRIALKEAIDLTQRFRKAAPASEHGGFYWAEGLLAVLKQPGCVGIRYYHGLSAEGQYRIVLVGVDARGNDITAPTTAPQSARAATASAGTGAAILLDHHFPCPPYCPVGSPL